MNIPQIPVHSKNCIVESAQKRDTLLEHVIVARVRLTDRKLKESLPTVSHIMPNKSVLQRLKKSSQILCTICSI